MKELRLATVCTGSDINDLRGNFSVHERYISDAAGKGADIICFPEMSLTGYAMPESSDRCLPLDAPEVGRLVDLSGETGMCIIFGMGEEGRYITEVVAEGGRILGTYRKTHLGFREEPVMNTGDDLPVFRTAKAVIGLQVCWESHFPEITATLASKGADLVLMPHASGLEVGRRRESWDRMMPARAYDNTVFVAACNAVGSNGAGTDFSGGTCVYDCRGRLIREEYTGECMMLTDLDGAEMDRIRGSDPGSMKNLYFLDKRRPEIYFR